MKLTKISAFSLLATGAASAQGIFNIVPNDDATESIPLRYTLSASVGYDDNVTPTSGNDQDATFGSVNLGAEYVNITPQTNFNVSANVGATHYFDSIDGGEDTYGNARLALNIAHSVSERLRLVTRNFVNYGLEPDYQYSFANDRTLEEYLFLSTDNAIGYKWTDRFATYTGIRYDTVSYDGDRSDVDNLTLYNQFRYIGSKTTVYTLDYRYRMADVEDANDSDNHHLLLGIEKRLNPNSVLIARAGVQYREVDGGDSSTSPFVEVGYRSKVNQQFSIRGDVRYGIEDYDRTFLVGGVPASFENTTALRVSFAADYALSPVVILTGGVNYIHSEYEDGNVGDAESDILNLYAGLTYRINDALSANVTYNFTTSDSDDIDSRDYDRNRVQVGMSYTF